MQPGRVFALKAFVQGTVTGMWLFQILTTCLKMLFFAHGVGLQKAWRHAFLILDTHGLLALIASWLPVLNAEAKEPKQLSTLGITDLRLSMVYEQVTPSKRRLLLMENLPQAAVALKVDQQWWFLAL